MTSVVVVHYRGGPHIDRCIESCWAHDAVTELIVVDNGGTAPEIRRRHPDAVVVDAGANLGFGRAANLGLDSARGPEVLVLNQDVVLAPGSVEQLVDVARRSGAWLVGPRLQNPAGSVVATKSAFPPPLRWNPPPAARAHAWTGVPWVAGATVLFAEGHTDLRFDPRLFMYVEDEELCWRVWRDGGTVVVAEGVCVEHAGGSAAGTRWSPWAVTRRTVANRARMVVWHRGWRALPRYLIGLARD